MKGFVTAIVFIFSASGGVFGQVMIEGGQNGVQQSNRDGRIEIPSPSPYGRTFTVVPPAAGIVDPSLRRNTTVGVSENFSPRTSIHTTTGATVQTTAPARTVHVIDVNHIQKLQKLERELGVLKTTKMMWLEFDAATFFKSGELTSKAKSILNKVLTYQQLSGGKNISVSYEFTGNESGSAAQFKTESLVNYLMVKSGLSPGWFTACEPKPLSPTPQSQLFYGQIPRPYRSVVNIRIQRCDS